ncbi:unnamed protein product [Prunus armeniaca]
MYVAVIRDSLGDWLDVARGISNLLIEMDSVLVVHLMKIPDAIGGHPLAGGCDLQHVHRERNCLADCLANGSYNLDIGLRWFGL